MSMIEKALVSSTAHGTPNASNSWQTPRWLFDKLSQHFEFALDAAATSDNALCNIHLSPEEDGLTYDWAEAVNGVEEIFMHFGREVGRAVWLNPPYGRDVGKWVAKARQESEKGLTVVVLIFARTDTRWWHDHVMRAEGIYFIKGRLKFLENGEVRHPAPAPSCLVVFQGDSKGRTPRLGTLLRDQPFVR